MADLFKLGGTTLISLCHRERILGLIADGALAILGNDSLAAAFLDDFRIGLRLRDEMVEIKGPVDLTSQPSVQQCHVFNTEGGILEPGHFYLGVSREKFRLPRNVYGLINTRSKYARRGLELARSSTFVIPGFGMVEPSPLVFEITVPHVLNGLTANDPYGFLLLFETDFEIATEIGSHSDRFPMNLLSPE